MAILLLRGALVARNWRRHRCRSDEFRDRGLDRVFDAEGHGRATLGIFILCHRKLLVLREDLDFR